MSKRMLVISADCHAAAQWATYEAYFEKKDIPAFRAWYGAEAENRQGRPGEGILFDSNFLDDMDETEAKASGGAGGTWDPKRRMEELDADGVAGEVIFPGAQNLGVPFHGRCPTTNRVDPQPAEQRQAGARAYNRWLADFCSENPDRCAGVAFLTYEDIDAAVAEIEWSRRAGLRGGIFLPAEWDDLPSYNDPRYEPIWAACQDADVPINTHPLGGGIDGYGTLPGATAIFLSEVKWFAHRPFTYVLWAGVFERYPKLKFILTEQMADWIPGTLEYFDDLYTRPIFAQIRKGLSLCPSEYWKRNCHVGASFLVENEVEIRHDIGIDKIMWGSDYPHPEGTWPHTKERLEQTFAGIPQDEIALMIGGNAAKVYGFDAEVLAPLVDRIGPELA